MAKSTFTNKTDKTQVAAQLQGLAHILECPEIKVTYLVSAGRLYRIDIGGGASHFYETPNEVTIWIVNYAIERQFIRNYKRDS